MWEGLPASANLQAYWALRDEVVVHEQASLSWQRLRVQPKYASANSPHSKLTAIGASGQEMKHGLVFLGQSQEVRQAKVTIQVASPFGTPQSMCSL